MSAIKIQDELKSIAKVDIFKDAKIEQNFVGNPFKINYAKASILTCDKWKFKCGGIPQGSFLLAFYENAFGEENVNEALLLRVVNPCSIPTDNEVVSSRIEYYKEGTKIGGNESTSELDQFTRFEFSFSGLECTILGTFYKTSNNENAKIEFGADVENFYSAHQYKVYKLTGKSLRYIVNLRDTDLPLNPNSNFRIGNIRYSSSRHKFSTNSEKTDEVVFMHTKDIIGKRTALFGMTRTGKSNTVKKLIEATQELSLKSKNITTSDNELNPFDNDDIPKQKVGQIIFDINGEYANKNLQDSTAIFEKYEKYVTRYSVLEKENFEVLKVNFYSDILGGQQLLRGYFKQFGKQADYVEDFLGVNLEKPDDPDKTVTHYRKIAAYKCCLYAAGFKPNGNKVWFQGKAEGLDDQILEEGSITPKDGITFDEAITWFSQVWKNYNTWEYLTQYEGKKGHQWADNDLKALLRFVSQYRSPDERNHVNSFIKLKSLIKYHSPSSDVSFEEKITETLRDGNIVIIDLSQGDPEIQHLYSERICKSIFDNSMTNFIESKPNNFIQFYFEEAHNLFPQKENKDLSQIYNRLAKEGAKLNIGMTYATQEVSSISSNILKNTQNWFIAHLNNEDETKELRKFYDFSDFTDSLVRFSALNDKGFVRMKTYSNPFVVPVQIDLFE